jgi:uncharacterized protein with HEPN domain
MNKGDEVRLRHILDAARNALAFSKGKSRKDLEANSMLSLSLVRLLEVIGEASRAVSAEFCSAHQEIPWKQIRGMRDRLVHGYYDINLDTVWETVTKDLPPLIAHLEKLVVR